MTESAHESPAPTQASHATPPHATLPVAVAGVVLISPGAFFVCAALLKSAFGIGYPFDVFDHALASPAAKAAFNTLSPVLFLGGPALAAILNAAAVAHVELRAAGDTLTTVLTVRRRVANLAVIGASLALLGVLLAYVVVENLPGGLGHATFALGLRPDRGGGSVCQPAGKRVTPCVGSESTALAA